MLTKIEPTKTLLQKYHDRSGPRYTSYPTTDLLGVDTSGVDYRRALRQLPPEEPISLYVHIPFCESVCYYCACHKIVTKHREYSGQYLELLIKEIDLLLPLLNSDGKQKRTVSQIHFGGGSPTFFNDEQLATLMQYLNQVFEVTPDAISSIEIDPRTVTEERVTHIRQMGFNRISFGVQDFDEKVQVAIHRVQPYQDVARLVELSQKLAFNSINMDLIYGLPHQTLESMKNTIQKVVALRPDRIALYAYAHLPERFKPQRRISGKDLPHAFVKLGLLQLAMDALLLAGYEYIGMDHFALPTDELFKAKKNGVLTRNFQGYSDGNTHSLIGLGVSAISQLNKIYTQNYKSLDSYTDAIQAKKLPLARSLSLNEDDLLRREVIIALMCQGHVNIPVVEQRYNIKFEDYFSDAIMRLEEFEQEGLLVRDPENIRVTEAGWFFVRPMAMAFDWYYWQHQNHSRFSKVL